MFAKIFQFDFTLQFKYPNKFIVKQSKKNERKETCYLKLQKNPPKVESHKKRINKQIHCSCKYRQQLTVKNGGSCSENDYKLPLGALTKRLRRVTDKHWHCNYETLSSKQRTSQHLKEVVIRDSIYVLAPSLALICFFSDIECFHYLVCLLINHIFLPFFTTFFKRFLHFSISLIWHCSSLQNWRAFTFLKNQISKSNLFCLLCLNTRKETKTRFYLISIFYFT